MRFHTLPVARVAALTDDAVAVTLAVPEALRSAFRYVPGQHLTLRYTDQAGQEQRRNYSVCSPAPAGSGPDQLTIGVRQIDGGDFSTRLVKELAAGDTLDVLPPSGRFTLPPRPGQHAAVTGGSGITPVLAMAATVLAAEPRSRFTLLRCDRSAASAMFQEETADLKDRYPDRFQLTYAFTREEQQSGLASGRLDSARLRTVLSALLGGTAEAAQAVDGWYLCGPMGLVDAARDALRGLGVDRDRVHSELFYAAPAAPADRDLGQRPDTGQEARLTATLDGRSGRWPVTGDQTLLETVLRNRADAPYACKGGVCGTCRARLVRGEVRMDRNFALESNEVEAGYVLACQSRPLTSDIELDFDA